MDMKLSLIGICLSACLLNVVSGGVIETVEGSLANLKHDIENELNTLAQPLNEGVKRLEERFEEYTIRQSEIELFSFWDMNMTACTDLGVSIEGSVKLGLNISNTVRDIISNVTDSYNALTSKCKSSWDPYTDVKCFIENIGTIKEELESIKPMIKLYTSLVMNLVNKVEDEFLTCIGDNPQPNPTAQPSTPAPQSTAAPSTAAPQSTAAPSTAAPQSTAAPSTAAPQSTAAPSTAAPQSTAAPSTAAPQSTAAPTTAAPKSTGAVSKTVSKSSAAPSFTEPGHLKSTANHKDVIVATTRKPWWHFW